MGANDSKPKSITERFLAQPIAATLVDGKLTFQPRKHHEGCGCIPCYHGRIAARVAAAKGGA